MTLKVDGTNGVLQAYDYQVLTTGFSYTFASGTQTLVINPAGTLATGTITMPSAPADGMVITVESTQQITALTVAANTGQTLVGGTVTLRQNQPLSYMYRLSNTTWYPFAGAANSDIISGTSVASTSGTSIDFTSIPSWVKRITVMLAGVSTNGTSNMRIQLGSGSIQSSGYLGSSAGIVSNLGFGSVQFSSGFDISDSASASAVRQGSIIFSLISANIWACQGVVGQSDTTRTCYLGGNVSLSGALDRVRITTVNGADTFDAGSINILYE